MESGKGGSLGGKCVSRRSIRVNLQFGPRTEPTLWNELVALPPYARAKRLRLLLSEAIQHRTGAPVSNVQRRAPPPASTKGSDEVEFSDNVAALLGRSLRM